MFSDSLFTFQVIYRNICRSCSRFSGLKIASSWSVFPSGTIAFFSGPVCRSDVGWFPQAVRLESGWSERVRYMVVVYTNGHQDTEENIVLGMDFTDKDR